MRLRRPQVTGRNLTSTAPSAVYLKAAAPVSPNAEVEAARKAAELERVRLAAERRLLEEERKKLALAVPPPAKQAQEEPAKGPQQVPSKKQDKEKESDPKRGVLLPKLVQPKGPSHFDGAWTITWRGVAPAYSPPRRSRRRPKERGVSVQCRFAPLHYGIRHGVRPAGPDP
jgi:hypothetical protein